ncbi:MAG TPA: hypothetical protein ENI23_17470 [bacterium]|nr:hypothetical protein [bacterium]
MARRKLKGSTEEVRIQFIMYAFSPDDGVWSGKYIIAKTVKEASDLFKQKVERFQADEGLSRRYSKYKLVQETSALQTTRTVVNRVLRR